MTNERKKKVVRRIVRYIIGSIITVIAFVILPGKLVDKNLDDVFKEEK